MAVIRREVGRSPTRLRADASALVIRGSRSPNHPTRRRPCIPYVNPRCRLCPQIQRSSLLDPLRPQRTKLRAPPGTMAIWGTSIPWAGHSTTWARRHRTTDPVPGGTTERSLFPLTNLVFGTGRHSAMSRVARPRSGSGGRAPGRLPVTALADELLQHCRRAPGRLSVAAVKGGNRVGSPRQPGGREAAGAPTQRAGSQDSVSVHEGNQAGRR